MAKRTIHTPEQDQQRAAPKAQLLPSGWRPGDKAMYIEADQDFSKISGYANVTVKGTLKGPVTLEAFRIFRGRRAWYVKGSLPTPTGGALAFEDDLTFKGKPKIDREFEAFMNGVLAQGPLNVAGHNGAVDVHALQRLIAESENAAEFFRELDEKIDPELWALERQCGLHRQ